MKQSFLNSLAGMGVSDAEAQVRTQGYTPKVAQVTVGELSISAGPAYPDVVRLEVEDGVVIAAMAGDACQIEHDA